MRTLTRIIAVLALCLAVAAPASAAIDPADRAWITAAGQPLTDWTLEYPGLIWTHEVSVRSTGALPDRPGNRHTASVTFSNFPSRFPQPWVITLTDEQCSATACSVAWAGEASLLPSAATFGEPAADGTVRIQATVPASSVRTTAPAGAPVPFASAGVDVTLTPVGWDDPREVSDLSRATSVSRTQTTLSDTVYSTVETSGTQARVTGTIAGVPAQQVLTSNWTGSGRGRATAGPPLRPAATRAVQLEYAPPQKNGRVTQATTVDVSIEDVARGALTTSTGVRLAGNAFRISHYPSLELAPGAAPAGTQPGELGVSTYQCPAATTPVDECDYYEQPEKQKIGTSGTLRYAFTPLGAVALQLTVPVTREVEGGPEVPLGTVTFTTALAPTGPGLPERLGDISIADPGTWTTARALGRDLTGPARLGALTARPEGTTPFVWLRSRRSGAL